MSTSVHRAVDYDDFMQRLFDAYESDWDSSECVTYLYVSYEYAYSAERLDFIAMARIIETLLYAACVSPSCALFDWASFVASSAAVGDEITLPSLPMGLACECVGAEARSSRIAPSSITPMTGRERLSAFVDLCRMWSA